MRTNVYRIRLTKLPITEMSAYRNVRLPKCLHTEMSVYRKVRLLKCPLTEMSYVGPSVTELSVTETSVYRYQLHVAGTTARG